MNTEQEPQAQAEPEVVAEYVEDETYGHRRWKWGKLPTPEVGDKLITLQAHREAMAEITRRFEELKRHGISHHVHNEAIAKKDAALDACVEALGIADEFCDSHSADECPDTVALPIKSAITQAKKARK